MIYTAEFVGEGHPDRLADRIVNVIVERALREDCDSLVGLECAVSRNNVYLTGCISSGLNKCSLYEEDIKYIVKDVYKQSKYCKEYKFIPYYNELNIIMDINFECLTNDVRKNRSISDDQSISIGYASNSRETRYMPIEQYLICKLGTEINYILNRKGIDYNMFGSDFKIMGEILYENNKYSWNKLTISIAHKKDFNFKEVYKYAKRLIHEAFAQLDKFESKQYEDLNNINDDLIYLNGAGDFYNGGPMEDNGLSGKKLVIDFYGPRIPIGGGAIYGKDIHRVDVLGALASREIALELVKKYNYYEVIVKLSFSPGKEIPDYIEAYSRDKFGIINIIPNEKLNKLSYYSIDSLYDRFFTKNNPHPDVLDNIFMDANIFNI